MKKAGIPLIAFLVFSCPLFSQYVDIPDGNFLNALIDEGIDADENGQIDSLEAIAVTILRIDRKEIADLTGIEAFVNLDSLDCGFNNISRLDVSKCENLKYLNIWDNQIDSIDISQNTGLADLWCSFNQLKTLDISNNLQLEILYCKENQLSNLNTENNTRLKKLGCANNPLITFDISKNLSIEMLDCAGIGLTDLDVSNLLELSILYCEGNSLTDLDFSNNNKLEFLRCSGNELMNLNLQNNPNLDYLDCPSNQLTSLDISNCPLLESLMCGNNKLSVLDISNHPELRIFNCSNNLLTNLETSNNQKLQYLYCHNNQLTHLNIRNNTALLDLWCGDNLFSRLDISRNSLLGTGYTWLKGLDLSNLPSLSEVCVWELPFPPQGLDVDTTGSPNVQFTMDCTPVLFAPDTLYQPDSIELLCSVNSIVCLVPENTGSGLSEIYEAKIDSFHISADDNSNFALPELANGTYWLYAISDSKKISDPESFTILGVDVDHDLNYSTRIYPNPVDKILVIEADFPNNYFVTVTSLNGQMLYGEQQGGKTCQIDLSSFQNGVYFITIRSKNIVITEKIIKL